MIDELISDIYGDVKLLYEDSTGKEQDFIFALISKIMRLKGEVMQCQK